MASGDAAGLCLGQQVCGVEVVVGEVVEELVYNVTDSTDSAQEDIHNVVNTVSIEWGAADSCDFAQVPNAEGVKQGTSGVLAIVGDIAVSVLAPESNVAERIVEYTDSLVECSHEDEGAGWDVAAGLASVPGGVSGVGLSGDRLVLFCQPKDPMGHLADRSIGASQEQVAV